MRKARSARVGQDAVPRHLEACCCVMDWWRMLRVLGMCLRDTASLRGGEVNRRHVLGSDAAPGQLLVASCCVQAACCAGPRRRSLEPGPGACAVGCQ